jgi:hypothetical protein
MMLALFTRFEVARAAIVGGGARSSAVIGGAALVALVSGCSSSLSQPFSQLKSGQAQITVYQLQNFEPPAATATAGAPPLALPPELQQWVTAGAAMLPPGMLPPGFLPGAPAAQAPAANVARFHNFRILKWVPLSDQKLIDESFDIFGRDKNFETAKSQCMYAEFGFSFAQGQAAPVDVLVSLSCNQAQPFNFVWPHGANTGLTGETTKRIVAIAQKALANTN